jgi:hypothetical protein
MAGMRRRSTAAVCAAVIEFLQADRRAGSRVDALPRRADSGTARGASDRAGAPRLLRASPDPAAVGGPGAARAVAAASRAYIDGSRRCSPRRATSSLSRACRHFQPLFPAFGCSLLPPEPGGGPGPVALIAHDGRHHRVSDGPPRAHSSLAGRSVPADKRASPARPPHKSSTLTGGRVSAKYLASISLRRQVGMAHRIRQAVVTASQPPEPLNYGPQAALREVRCRPHVAPREESPCRRTTLLGRNRTRRSMWSGRVAAGRQTGPRPAGGAGIVTPAESPSRPVPARHASTPSYTAGSSTFSRRTPTVVTRLPGGTRRHHVGVRHAGVRRRREVVLFLG